MLNLKHTCNKLTSIKMVTSVSTNRRGSGVPLSSPTSEALIPRMKAPLEALERSDSRSILENVYSEKNSILFYGLGNDENMTLAI